MSREKIVVISSFLSGKVHENLAEINIHPMLKNLCISLMYCHNKYFDLDLNDFRGDAYTGLPIDRALNHYLFIEACVKHP